LIKFKGSEELDLDNKFSYISSSLKNLATDLKITIVITYPIIDEVDKDKNDIPILSDFSYADSIANDSDIVIFLHREEVYLRQNEPEINDILSYGKWKNQLNKSLDITDCIVAKYRNGFNSRTKMLYIDSVSKFIDLERVKSNEK
jgi:replicative DNA helicase